jgi:aminopeptidase N
LSDDTAQTTLDRAAEALRFYNAWLGAYPAREVDLVEVDPSGALGIAWSGLLFLDGPALLDTYGDFDPEGLASIVGHEVAHLWWGILIGGDSNKHPFIQEGLATVSSLLYLEDTLGPDAATGELEAWVIAPSRRLLSAGDAVVDLPIAEEQDERIRSDAAYGKGSLGFLAIREQIGAEAFAAALREIATDFRWGEVAPQDLRAAFEKASGQDLEDLWSHWFDETAMTSEEIDQLSTIFK